MFCFVVVVGMLATTVVAQGNCTSGSTCLNCASQPGCGWCSASRTCLQGTAQGPVNGYCEPTGKLWNFGTCPTCGSYSDCRACTLANGDCAFCPATNQCVSYDDASCPAKLQSCPCNQYQSCSACTLLSNTACRWCPAAAGGGCIDDTANCTTGAPAATCPCGDNKNCDACLDDFNGALNNECSWCGGGVGCQDKGSKTCAIATLSCPAKCESLTAGGCQKCLANDGCTWCSDKNVCADATKALCFASHTCPEDHCAKFQSCDTCNERPTCGWCVEQTNTSTVMSCKSTLPGVTDTCTGKTNVSCTEYCHAQHRCDDCQNARGCAWCTINDTAKCVNFDVQTNELANCAVKLACSADTGGGGLDVTGSFFLGMFVCVVVVGLGGVIVVYYRKRKASQYSALK